MNGGVAALAWDADGDYSSLYVGGNFVNAGGKSSAYLGRWRNAAIWDGGGSDNNASTAANWSGDTVPATSDVAVFDSTSSKNSILDGSFSATLGGLVVESGYNGTISHHRSISLTGNLEVYSGTLALADPSVYTFIVGGSVIHTGGIISQTRPVNNADMPFLQIEDSAAAVKYRGVEIDTSGFGNDLGDVTVMVQAVDTTNNEYCTSALPAGLPYAGRCYTINPTHNLPADLTFWALTSEITVISPTITAPAIYRHVPPWAKLASTTGTNGDYTWVKATTPGFSSFLIGEDTNAPTAVSDTITTTANSPVFIDVLANDLPGGNGAPTLQSVGQPMNGTAVISGTGILYTVNLNFVGLDTFTYTISDGLFVSTTTVTVTVSPVNNPTTFIYLPLILRNP
ncbi:MAG: Ig-like domain-containing protein [Ardenticatenaceae bacterium]|nr:Ig-like domain-containing protein [Ardenticatenaceae bacterium]